MAQVTKQFTENWESSHRSMWWFKANGTNATASGSTVTVAVPSITASYQYGGKNHAMTNISDAILQIGQNTSNRVNYSASEQVWASGASKTLTKSKQNVTINTSSIFNSNNKTSKTVNVYLNSNSTLLYGEVSASSWKQIGSGDSSLDNGLNASCGSWGPLATVTLNAPPTFANSAMRFNTSYGVYAGLTTASVDISSLSAKYGGTISSAVLKIGNQTASRTTDGTLSIELNTVGTFTPTITVTDSRGQITTESLPAITVNDYVAPSVSITAERTLNSGVPDDESQSAIYGVITAKFTFLDAMASLQQPTVTGGTVNPVWYKTRASNGTLSNPVNWNDTSSIHSGDTLYCLVGKFNLNDSYTVSVQPKDSRGTGTSIAAIIASAFYTVDYLAGGRGIAFGQPSTEEGFFCAMDTHILPYTGFIQMFAGASNKVPSGWLMCNGQAVSRTKYARLFAVIGTTYGAGDGRTTFNLPDMRNRVPVGAGDTYALNAKGGANSISYTPDGSVDGHKLTVDEMPSHTHTFEYAQYQRGSGTNAASALQYTGSTKTTAARGGDKAHTHGFTGTNATLDVRQPYIGINFIIYAGV